MPFGKPGSKGGSGRYADVAQWAWVDRPQHIEVRVTRFALASAQRRGTLHREEVWAIARHGDFSVDAASRERSARGRDQCRGGWNVTPRSDADQTLCRACDITKHESYDLTIGMNEIRSSLSFDERYHPLKCFKAQCQPVQ
jgi:hypothetical protein